jgi:hypothetical protein
VGKSQPVEVYEPRGINPLTNDALENAELTFMDTHPDCFLSLIELRDQALSDTFVQQNSAECNDAASDSSTMDVDKEHRAKTLLRQARVLLEVNEEESAYSADHSSAVRSYQVGDFAKAVSRLERLEKMDPQRVGDKASEYLLGQARACLQKPPADFDGVYHAAEK